MRIWTFGVSMLGLLSLSACNLPPGNAAVGHHTYAQAETGSLIGGGPPPEEIGKNPEASFTQPGFGIGSAGYIAPGDKR